MTERRITLGRRWIDRGIDLVRLRFRPPSAPDASPAQPWPDRADLAALEPAPRPAVLDLFDRIEADALAVYRANGLPDQPGDYVRGPRKKRWSPIGRSLDPTEKWDLILQRQTGKGWRYASLQTLGQQAGVADEVRLASDCLRVIQTLKQRLGDTASTTLAEEFQSALELGERADTLARLVAAHRPAQIGAPSRLQLSIPAPKARRRKTT